MPANKDPKNPDKWICQFYYTDWTGTRKKKYKRGFDTKHAAQEWERDFLKQHTADVGMRMGAFIDLYMEDITHRLRLSTIENKRYIIDLKIRPYFENKPLSSITAADVRKWQNELMDGNYSPTYLKAVHNQLTAIFNYAVKYYGLPSNPCHQAGSIGKKHADEMQFWTIDEYNQFIEAIKDKPRSFAAFQTLYYTGMRIGELMALTAADIDTDNGVITISKSYQRINGKDIITPPKTPKSNRTITIPKFLSDDLRAYIAQIFGLKDDDRIFPFTKAFLEHEMRRGCQLSGVKKIRLHDIRHSHASLLIEMGFSPLLIADRLGHEKVETTLNIYAHLYPSKQAEISDQLQRLNDSKMLLKNS